MKTYNVTRWMKIPITVMVKGEDELNIVKALSDEQFCYHYTEHTDRDEQPFAEHYENYERVNPNEQEVELIDEEEEE